MTNDDTSNRDATSRESSATPGESATHALVFRALDLITVPELVELRLLHHLDHLAREFANLCHPVPGMRGATGRASHVALVLAALYVAVATRNDAQLDAAWQWAFEILPAGSPESEDEATVEAAFEALTDSRLPKRAAKASYRSGLGNVLARQLCLSSMPMNGLSAAVAVTNREVRRLPRRSTTAARARLLRGDVLYWCREHYADDLRGSGERAKAAPRWIAERICQGLQKYFEEEVPNAVFQLDTLAELAAAAAPRILGAPDESLALDRAEALVEDAARVAGMPSTRVKNLFAAEAMRAARRAGKP